MTYEVHTADCLQHMRTMADNAVDAVVTDPPYGLSDRCEDSGKVLARAARQTAAPAPAKAGKKRGRSATAETTGKAETPLQATMEFPAGRPAENAPPAPEVVEKGKVVLEVLALLHSAGGRLDRLTLEGGLILMRNENLRQRIVSGGTVSAAPAGASAPPRIGHMDAFLQEFNRSQFSLSTEYLTQHIALGPEAPTLAQLRGHPVAENALKRAREALAAMERIRGTTGCAAVLEGKRFIGCELSAEYADIARARIAHHAAQGVLELEDANV